MTTHSCSSEAAFEQRMQPEPHDVPAGQDDGQHRGSAEQDGRDNEVFSTLAKALHAGLHRTFARVVD